MGMFWIHWHVLPVRQGILSIGVWLQDECVQEKSSYCLEWGVRLLQLGQPQNFDVDITEFQTSNMSVFVTQTASSWSAHV